MNPFILYFHIPFCLRKCPYCDFNSYAVSTVPEKDYCAALMSELDFRAAQPEWRGRQVKSIYFGGGTPSLLTARALEQILKLTEHLFGIQSGAEITLEANPGTVDGDYLQAIRTAGINRLSLGAQSFSPGLLRQLGRIHTVEQTLAAVSAARTAGFENLSLDLIYGVPSQTLSDLRSDLARVIDLAPEHISAYILTLEEGTPLFKGWKKKKFAMPSELLLLQMMRTVERTLKHAGFDRYEISNYAKAGLEARHNGAYWSGCDYLGIGAGAHGYLTEKGGMYLRAARRWANVPRFESYIEWAIGRGGAERQQENLSLGSLVFEFLFLGLRRIGGISTSEFAHRFGFPLEEPYGPVIKELQEMKCLRQEADRLRLTSKGLRVADTVFERLAACEIPVHLARDCG